MAAQNVHTSHTSVHRLSSPPESYLSIDEQTDKLIETKGADYLDRERAK